MSVQLPSAIGAQVTSLSDQDRQPSRVGDFVLASDLRFYTRSLSMEFKVQQLIKRLSDIFLSFMGLALLMPVLISIAALTYIFSPGPIFYKSLRMGKNNKPFHMYKFRTMIVNADAIREKLRKEAHLEGQLFKMENDPRITKFGHFLRRYSLDELPQLLNVFIGNMSLVGPRPLPPDESALFKEPYTLRFNVLPGITGLWQVSGRSNLTFEQLCQLELNYVHRWSLGQDFSILLKTIPVVLLKKGAM